jgi:hypothetical protein
MTCLDFKWKSEDISGLQIADLIAYPLTRHVLNPQAVNLAYDVLAPNIFMEGGKLWVSKSIHPNRHKKRVATNLTTLPIGDTPIPINGTRPLFCVQR